MTIFGVYPKQDKVYQDYHSKKVKVAKKRMLDFPLLNKIVDNFNGYEKLKWKESQNKVFLVATVYPERLWLSDYLLFNLESKNKKKRKLKNFKDPIIIDRNHNDFPNVLIKLETAIKLFVDSTDKKRRLNEFKKRISSHNYYVSDSAASEILTAYDFGTSVGFDNVKLNPTITSGKNGDIKVIINGHEVFFELTAPSEKEAERKIQRIFDDLAEYIGKRNCNKNFNFIIWVNTLSFPLDKDGNIDEVESKKMLKLEADKIFFEKLVGCNGLISLDHEFYSINGEEYLNQLMDNNPQLIRDDLLTLLKDQSILRKWSEFVKLRDLNLTPFESIACAYGGDGVFVEIQGHSSYPSEVGLLEEKSFLNKIRKLIGEKIDKEQYEKGKPAIILLKTSLWSNWYESDESDFLKIKSVIQEEIQKTPYLSGVIIYSADFRNGRFIENSNAVGGSIIEKEDLKKLGLKLVKSDFS